MQTSLEEDRVAQLRVVGRHAEAARDLAAECCCPDGLGQGGPALFCYGECCRNNRSGGVEHGGEVGVVEVERMCHGPVDERGRRRRKPLSGDQHGGLCGSCPTGRGDAGGAHGILSRGSNRHANGVEDASLRRSRYLVGEAGAVRCSSEVGEPADKSFNHRSVPAAGSETR